MGGIETTGCYVKIHSLTHWPLEDVALIRSNFQTYARDI